MKTYWYRSYQYQYNIKLKGAIETGSETGSEDDAMSGAEEKRSLPVEEKRTDWDLNEMQIEGWIDH